MAYHADRSLKAKLRRRLVRLCARRPATRPPGPMVTFAFDDVPASAVETGAAILERLGVRGTFFVAGALAGKRDAAGLMADVGALKRLSEAGHEIGCHTHGHLDLGRAGAAEALSDIGRNAALFADWGLPAAATFAYPFGDVAPTAKRALAGRFSLMRALHPGLVTAGVDLNQAPAVPVEGPGGEALGLKWLARATGRKAWLILTTHDIAETPSPWGATPATLETLVRAALDAGFEPVTAAQGAARLSA